MAEPPPFPPCLRVLVTGSPIFCILVILSCSAQTQVGDWGLGNREPNLLIFYSFIFTTGNPGSVIVPVKLRCLYGVKIPS